MTKLLTNQSFHQNHFPIIKKFQNLLNLVVTKQKKIKSKLSNIDSYIFDSYNYINFLKNCRLRRGIVCKEISNDEDESFDPNEPRYCLCNQIAYGTMVACDNKKVGIIIKKYY